MTFTSGADPRAHAGVTVNVSPFSKCTRKHFPQSHLDMTTVSTLWQTWSVFVVILLPKAYRSFKKLLSVNETWLCNPAPPAELSRVKKWQTLKEKVEKDWAFGKYPLTQCKQQPGESQTQIILILTETKAQCCLLHHCTIERNFKHFNFALLYILSLKSYKRKNVIGCHLEVANDRTTHCFDVELRFISVTLSLKPFLHFLYIFIF